MIRIWVLAACLVITDSTFGQSAESGRKFLDALGNDLAKQVSFEFKNDEERKDWSNLPGRMHKRNGVSFGEMDDAQKQAAYGLLQAGLSSQGYAKAIGVMRLDDVWADAMNARRQGQGAMFSSTLYWMAVFGKPDDAGAWGWQLDGHHLAINYTSVNGEARLTPMFFGAEPETVPSGPYAGWRIFGTERLKAFRLMESLNKDQQGKAILADTIPEAIFEGPEAAGTLKNMEGLMASEMDDEQRTLLWDLINEYLDNAPREVADVQREKIVGDGDEKLHFAWMGPVDDSANVYFRVHGPSVLIEYDNVYAGRARPPYSNHIHTILREPSNDYGEDLLRKHYAESDHHKH